MIRPLAYITATWSKDEFESRELAAKYCRAVYEAGYSPICPCLFQNSFLLDELPQEHKDRLEMATELLRRSRILVVCGNGSNEEVKSDIATAKRLHIVATTLDGILKVDGRSRNIVSNSD